MTIHLSETEHSLYREEGYFVLAGVFTLTEMEELASLIEAHHRRHEDRLRESGGEGISRAGEIAFTAFLAEQDAGIRTFVCRQEFVALSTQLLGPDVDLYWNQSVYKGPGGSQPFPWHQDDGYTPVEPSPYLTVWLAISDATPENGCISVLPGSHKRGLVEHHPTPLGLSCHALDDPDQGVMVPVRTGSMAVFPSLTMHKSGINRSHAMRKAYVIQYAVAGLRDARTGRVFDDKLPIARSGLAAGHFK